MEDELEQLLIHRDYNIEKLWSLGLERSHTDEGKRTAVLYFIYQDLWYNKNNKHALNDNSIDRYLLIF